MTFNLFLGIHRGPSPAGYDKPLHTTPSTHAEAMCRLNKKWLEPKWLICNASENEGVDLTDNREIADTPGASIEFCLSLRE